MPVNLDDVVIINDKNEIQQGGPLFDWKGNLRPHSIKEALQIIAKYAALLESKEEK